MPPTPRSRAARPLTRGDVARNEHPQIAINSAIAHRISRIAIAAFLAPAFATAALMHKAEMLAENRLANGRKRLSAYLRQWTVEAYSRLVRTRAAPRRSMPPRAHIADNSR